MEAWRELQACACDDPRIAFVDEEWSRDETLGLLASCDGLISLHRAEGFGRPIAEAVLLRRLVVATNWSGNVDFRESGLQLLVEPQLRPVPAGAYSWGEGQFWAEPDRTAAARALKEAVPVAGPAAAAPPPGAEFDPATVGARYRARLEALGIIES